MLKGQKYSRLTEYLAGCDSESIVLSFSEIEKILRQELPKSAYSYPAWWNPSGGHSHCQSWVKAGYTAEQVNLFKRSVVFRKVDASLLVHPKIAEESANSSMPQSKHESIKIFGNEFLFVQKLLPECDENGEIKKFNPQKLYQNVDGLPLLPDGAGAFCKFYIKADEAPGVYLWVLDGNVIYIGETSQLGRRFNMGYGNISPRNCYVGGQSTNCRMNKVVLKLYQSGKTIDLYFCRTDNYKRLELELLRRIKTKYNVKDN